MNTDKLKALIAEKGMTIDSVAKEIGMDPSTFYRKLKSNGNNFSIGEMHALQELLEIATEDCVNIFLCNHSHKCE